MRIQHDGTKETKTDHLLYDGKILHMGMGCVHVYNGKYILSFKVKPIVTFEMKSILRNSICNYDFSICDQS